MRERIVVLLVEDAAVISRMVSYRLEKSGFEVLAAPDGEAALALLATVVPDVILLDMSLSGMDGAELCRILKADERSRSIPVILFTASAHRDELLVRTGADAVIGKPYEPGEMIETIRRHARSGKGAP
jgi:CheY-like chemotaxis protein